MMDVWSKRRAAVAAEEAAEAQQAEDALRAEEAALQEEKTDAELLEELGLPDPDSLVEGDDFKGFLGDAVPARLKNRALRRLWRVNPVLANLDGLVDYGQDFTDAAMVVENLQTAYQVGKGMLAHVEAMARKAEAEAEAEALAEAGGDDAAPDADAESLALEASEDVIPDQVQEAAAPAEEGPQGLDDAPHAAAPTRRRMQFSFETEGAA
ncbi:hypothetical protein AIOL_001488 [Candidatus Rhodobacter oscarellae]|uniref:DUF3306 domain-containing protein n=1 Tax=Candidatus Rhodobacter oscarellae TaxID=1675527 RepID=A0A0J9E3W1_9RHOB|nr:hypothetical protein AIOL_001488 [Candidatus Rhodobacter lobularis]